MTDTTPSPARPRRQQRAALWLLVLVALIAAACGSEATAADPPAPTTTAVSPVTTTETPATTAAPVTTAAPPSTATPEQVGALLPPGTHVGISWFAPTPAGTEEIAFDLWEQANVDATVGRVMLDWIDVEPEEGRYVFDDMEEQLIDITDRGALPMVSIVASDVSGTPFPEWLGGFDPERAAAAYGRMLEAAAPILETYGVWLLAVANEPPLAEELDIPEFTRFVAGVEELADSIIPDIAVTFVFAGGDALRTDPDTQALADVVDVFSVNHYCLDADLLVIDLDETEPYLYSSIRLAGDKPVVFQEFGCPASEALGSDEEYQAAWFDAAFDVIRADDQIIAAYVFEFGNWSDELFDLSYGEAAAAEPESAVGFQRAAEWLGTSGLIRPDGTTRPAWDIYLANLGG